MLVQTFPFFDFRKALRIVLLASMLTVGALQVTRCQEADDDAGEVARDQHSRMYGE